MLFLCEASYAYGNRIKIHNESENFIDIEVSVEHLHVDLSGIDKKIDWCLPGLDIFDGVEVYSFFYRRPQTIKDCKQDEKEFLDMLKGAKTFRIVGVGAKIIEQQPIPKHFISKAQKSKALVKTTSLAFVRLQVGKQCKSYFSGHCDLPENYWANTIPPNANKNDKK